ncbi:MAG: LacI family transcriptional regulator [Chloroflexi bacterium]|nr:LacI family transcriptional regulator [Chloroflexota bacterium]
MTTVSRVINNVPNVRPEVRDKVLATIKALNYRPNRVARRLRVKRSNVLGLIIPDIQNPFFTSIARGIEDVAYQHGYSVVLCNTDESCDKERLYVDVMCAEEVAGVILATTNEADTHLQQLGQCGIPVIGIDRQVRNHAIDSVLVSNREGACEAVSHLIGLGHTRIGFIGLPLGLTVGSERYQGYLDALAQHGRTPLDELIRIGDAKQSSGYQCASELLALGCPMTALFVANNLMTLGALDAIHERRIVIPEQLSVVSFDDMPLVAYLQPPLTTVVQPAYQLGQTAFTLLHDRIEQPGMPVKHIRLQTTLVIRSSTAQPSGWTVEYGGDHHIKY